jgi:hypothetical protein
MMPPPIVGVLNEAMVAWGRSGPSCQAERGIGPDLSIAEKSRSALRS